MQRIENCLYVHAKGACYLCHQPHDCVDTEIIIEGEGILAICRGCIADLARTTGFDLDDRSTEIELLRIERDEARAEAKASDHLISTLRDHADRIVQNRIERANAKAK